MRKITKTVLATGCALGAFAATPAFAQAQSETTDATGTSVTSAPADQVGEKGEILVTGSRIRQDPTRSALPLQVITPA